MIRYEEFMGVDRPVLNAFTLDWVIGWHRGAARMGASFVDPSKEY